MGERIVDLLESANAEIKRLTEALAAAEARVRELEEECDAYLMQRTAAEARVRVARRCCACGEVFGECRCTFDRESRLAAATARVRELEEECERLDSLRVLLQSDRAAANALLETVPGLCGIGVEEWQHERRAHLASQPSAPRNELEGMAQELAGMPAPPHILGEFGYCGTCKSTTCNAAAIRNVERLPPRTIPDDQLVPPAPTRTQAEQAVLDAMADVDEDTLRNTLDSRHTTLENQALARAELARRRLR